MMWVVIQQRQNGEAFGVPRMVRLEGAATDGEAAAAAVAAAFPNQEGPENRETFRVVAFPLAAAGVAIPVIVVSPRFDRDVAHYRPVTAGGGA